MYLVVGNCGYGNGAGNNLSKAVAGRAVHATFAQVGRFSHLPDKETMRKVVAELKSVRGYAIDFMGIFYSRDLNVDRDVTFSSLVTGDYSFLNGTIEDSTGFCIMKDKYRDYLDRVIVPYSQSVGYSFKGREFMVGAPVKPQNIVGWWPLNSNLNDYGGNNYNGQNNGVGYTSSWSSGYTSP